MVHVALLTQFFVSVASKESRQEVVSSLVGGARLMEQQSLIRVICSHEN